MARATEAVQKTHRPSGGAASEAAGWQRSGGDMATKDRRLRSSQHQKTHRAHVSLHDVAPDGETRGRPPSQLQAAVVDTRKPPATKSSIRATERKSCIEPGPRRTPLKRRHAGTGSAKKVAHPTAPRCGIGRTALNCAGAEVTPPKRASIGLFN